MMQKNPRVPSKSSSGTMNFVSPSPVRAIGELNSNKGAISSSNIFTGGGNQMEQSNSTNNSRRNTASKEQINAIINKNQNSGT